MKDSSVRVVFDQEFDIFLEAGANVMFTCPPGLVLTGPNTSTCMENGEWEPDLDNRQISCKGALILILEVCNTN